MSSRREVGHVPGIGGDSWGVWKLAVWKRNPLYSAGKTWRIVGGMGLGIGAFVALDILLVNLTIHSSPWIAGTTMGVLVLSAVIGLFLIARAFTKPKELPLPVGIALVRLYRDKVWVWAKRAGMGIAAFGVLGLVLPGNFKIIGWMLAGFVAFFAAFMLPIGYIAARDKDRALTGVEAMPWVHWQFSEEQWRLMTAVEVERAKVAAVSTFSWKKQWKTMAFTLVLMVLMARLEAGSWLVAGEICGGGVGLIALMVLLVRVDAKNVPGRKERAMAKAGRDAYLRMGACSGRADFRPGWRWICTWWRLRWMSMHRGRWCWILRRWFRGGVGRVFIRWSSGC